MKIFYHWEKFKKFTNGKKEYIIAGIGNFDGLHLGHQKIINIISDKCKEDTFGNSKTMLISFEPHTRLFLKTVDGNFLINMRDEWIRILEDYNIDYVLLLPFDEYLKNFSSKDFVEHILIDSLNVCSLVVGENFHFGNNGTGNIDFLKKYADKIHIILISILNNTNGQISSSNIRNAIKNSDLETAYELMGRDYNISGIVIHGKKRGRTIGFPTANILPSSSKILPRFGVYEVIVSSVSGLLLDQRKGVANIGVRPTFNDELFPTLEVHILDFDADLYGQCLNVKFIKHIRDEKKFNSLEDLKEQIKQDVRFVDRTVK